MIEGCSAGSALRSSTTHWRDLTRLLGGFERCVEACARLDAHRESPYEAESVRRRGRPAVRRTHAAIIFEERLRRLTHRLDQEIDRVTSEQLLQDLCAKIAAVAA